MIRTGPTGKTRFRSTFTGKLVLQLEMRYLPTSEHSDSYVHSWRDARAEDLLEYNIGDRLSAGTSIITGG